MTDNLRDFPSAVVPDGVDILTPRDFLADTIGISPYKSYLSVEELLSRLKHPPMIFEELLHIIEARYGCTEAAQLLRIGEYEFNKLVDGDS